MPDRNLTGDNPVKYLKLLYVQVLIGLAIGITVGTSGPNSARR